MTLTLMVAVSDLDLDFGLGYYMQWFRKVSFE